MEPNPPIENFGPLKTNEIEEIASVMRNLNSNQKRVKEIQQSIENGQYIDALKKIIALVSIVNNYKPGLELIAFKRAYPSAVAFIEQNIYNNPKETIEKIARDLNLQKYLFGPEILVSQEEPFTEEEIREEIEQNIQGLKKYQNERQLASQNITLPGIYRQDARNAAQIILGSEAFKNANKKSLLDTLIDGKPSPATDQLLARLNAESNGFVTKKTRNPLAFKALLENPFSGSPDAQFIKNWSNNGVRINDYLKEFVKVNDQQRLSKAKEAKEERMEKFNEAIEYAKESQSPELVEWSNRKELIKANAVARELQNVNKGNLILTVTATPNEVEQWVPAEVLILNAMSLEETGVGLGPISKDSSNAYVGRFCTENGTVRTIMPLKIVNKRDYASVLTAAFVSAGVKWNSFLRARDNIRKLMTEKVKNSSRFDPYVYLKQGEKASKDPEQWKEGLVASRNTYLKQMLLDSRAYYGNRKEVIDFRLEEKNNLPGKVWVFYSACLIGSKNIELPGTLTPSSLEGTRWFESGLTTANWKAVEFTEYEQQQRCWEEMYESVSKMQFDWFSEVGPEEYFHAKQSWMRLMNSLFNTTFIARRKAIEMGKNYFESLLVLESDNPLVNARNTLQINTQYQKAREEDRENILNGARPTSQVAINDVLRNLTKGKRVLDFESLPIKKTRGQTFGNELHKAKQENEIKLLSKGGGNLTFGEYRRLIKDYGNVGAMKIVSGALLRNPGMELPPALTEKLGIMGASSVDRARELNRLVN